jgi:hypothetical protein
LVFLFPVHAVESTLQSLWRLIGELRVQTQNFHAKRIFAVREKVISYFQLIFSLIFSRWPQNFAHCIAAYLLLCQHQVPLPHAHTCFGLIESKAFKNERWFQPIGFVNQIRTHLCFCNSKDMVVKRGHVLVHCWRKGRMLCPTLLTSPFGSYERLIYSFVLGHVSLVVSRCSALPHPSHKQTMPQTTLATFQFHTVLPARPPQSRLCFFCCNAALQFQLILSSIKIVKHFNNFAAHLSQLLFITPTVVDFLVSCVMNAVSSQAFFVNYSINNAINFPHFFFLVFCHTLPLCHLQWPSISSCVAGALDTC